MIEKIGHIRNPLTVIAVFAAIAEISGTVVLPFITPNLQATYIWFLMLFPAALVLLFFITLFFKHAVLYAPSDFETSSDFLQLLGMLRPATPRELLEKRMEDVKVLTESITGSKTAGSPPQPFVQFYDTVEKAERLGLKKLESELKVPVAIQVRIPGVDRIFDGVVASEKGTKIVELILAVSSAPDFNRIERHLRNLRDVISQVHKISKVNVSVIMVVVVDRTNTPTFDLPLSFVSPLLEGFDVEIRTYDLHALEEEFASFPVDEDSTHKQ